MLRHNAYVVPPHFTSSCRHFVISHHSKKGESRTVRCFERDHIYITFFTARLLIIALFYYYCQSCAVPGLQIKLYSRYVCTGYDSVSVYIGLGTVMERIPTSKEGLLSFIHRPILGLLPH